NLGIWIERSVADVIEDSQRQKIREIEKQTEVAKALERSKAEVQQVRSDYTYGEEARHKEHSRKEKLKDTNFELEEEARRQLYAYHKKMREIVFNTVNAEWADYILKELEKVDNSIPEFFRKNPQVLQYYPELSQLIALPQPSLTLNGPSAAVNTRNSSDLSYNGLQKRRGGDSN